MAPKASHVGCQGMGGGTVAPKASHVGCQGMGGGTVAPKASHVGCQGMGGGTVAPKASQQYAHKPQLCQHALLRPDLPNQMAPSPSPTPNGR